MTRPDDAEDGAVWIVSELMPDGTYAPAITFDADTAVALTEANAVTYALSILEAAQAADYDAAVIRQLTPVVGHDVAALMIRNEVRPNRPEPRPSGTPLRLVPGVSATSGGAFLIIEVAGVVSGQWDVPTAREHALQILEAAIVAGFDAAYRRALVAGIDVPEPVAERIVDDLRNFRDPPHEGPDDHG